MFHKTKNVFKKTHITSLWLSLTILLLLHTFVAASSFKEDIEKYFTELKEGYDNIANAQAVKGTSLPRTDRYFVSALKRHQVFYSLIKTNSKGVVISEVIRGQTPERNYRKVDNQRWFTAVSTKHEGYEGFMKEEETGRYYTLWGKPILKGNTHFVGGVVAKVDLWDCFHKFSATVEEPFLIRLGNLSLYSHKWEKGTPYDEEALVIPGVKNISIRFPKSSIEPVPADNAALSTAGDSSIKAIGETADTEKGKKDKSSTKKMGTIQKIIIAVIGIALLTLLFFLSKLISRFKDWRLRKKIDKEENVFD